MSGEDEHRVEQQLGLNLLLLLSGLPTTTPTYRSQGLEYVLETFDLRAHEHERHRHRDLISPQIN